ncbi:prostatic acid phosphatase-like [Sitodiplosis mosellana]|uniref:prostatic acid phosphatase-like n=1 Tax=Sitodiplosis mosellana TaxID=263140 RepID=UPI002444CD20|nr:prostatic acid phosphatase-like [Sitodiplosis mosellana]
MIALFGFILILVLSNFEFGYCIHFPINSAAIGNASAGISREYQLIFAHVLYRHGDRNIVGTFPKNQYSDLKYWPGGYGALTNVGKRQQYELGKYIRRRYLKKLISEYYLPNEVYIRSTDVDRTLISAQCNLAGLYPPTGQQVWQASFKWQPIPVHTVALESDYLLYPVPTSCPRFTHYFNEYLQSVEMKSLMREHKDFIDFLRKNSGIQNMTLEALTILYDTLFVQNLKGFALRDWEKKAFNSNRTLAYLAGVYYEAFSHTKEMKKLEAGFLLKEILDRFKNKSLSLLQRSLHIYSAHNLTIANVLNTLNFFKDLHIPPYASSMYFELYKRGAEYFVQFFYRRTPTETAPLKILNCDVMCPLKRVYEIYKDVLPSDTESYATLCRLPN